MSKKYGRSLIFTSIMALSLILIFVQFFLSIGADIKESTYKDLQTTAEQHVATLEAKISGQYSLLESLALHFSHSNTLNDKEYLTELLRDFAQAGGFSIMGIANKQGIAITSDGSDYDISDRAYFRSTLAGRKSIEKLEASKNDGAESIVLSVPVKDNYGITFATIFGAISTKDFEKGLASSAYDENTYSFLADSNGEIIIRSENPNFLHTTGNIFDLIDNSNNSKREINNFKKNLQNGKSGIVQLKINNSTRYILYTSLQSSCSRLPYGAEQWYLFTSVPSTAVKTDNWPFYRTMVILASEMLIIASAAVVYIVVQSYKKSKKVEKETEDIRQSVEMYRIVNEFSDNIIFSVDRDNGEISFNNVYEKVFKRKPFIQKVSDCKLQNPFINRYDLSAYSKFINDAIEGLPKASAEFRILRPDGIYDWYKADTVTLYDINGIPTKTIGKLTNVQEQHNVIEELTMRAESDSLTNILNHISLREKVNRYLASSGKEGLHALFYIDLDNFKAVNDNLGHLAGDELLIYIARVIQSLFRDSDLVGRMGGDEFAVFVKDMHHDSLINKKANALVSKINTLTVPGTDSKLSCSVGISVYGRDGVTFEELYASADKALYKAKQIKNTYLFYSPFDSEMKVGAHEHSIMSSPYDDDNLY